MKVTEVKVTNGGTGYTSAPAVEFTGGGGDGARATAKIDAGGKVINVKIDAGGEGYTSAPVVAFSGGTGSGALGTATVG